MPNPGKTIANVQPPPNPATAGNVRAAKHEATRRNIGEQAADLVPEIFEANPHLDPTRDRAAVTRYAVKLARIERVYRWLVDQEDEVFADAERGEAHRVFDRLEKWEGGAARDEERLAIAPLTRARLGLTIARAADLSTVLSEPDPVKRRELMAEAGIEDDDEVDG